MAIIYTYPNLPLSNLSAEDLLVITNVDATNNNPTRSVTLADIATYVTGTGSGTGTTNKIVKFTDGANGLLGDSIMTESTGLIDLAGQFVSTSSPTLTQGAPVSGIKAILNGTTAAPNVALYGESKNTGSTQADSNYGLFAKGEFEGTAGFTGFVIGGNLEGRYDGTGTNGANATVYGSYNLARATTTANGTVSYMIGANNLAKLEGANVTATNLQGTHSTVELSNGTAGDVIVQILDFDGTGGTVTGDLSYLQIQNDTMPTVAGTSRAIKSLSVLPSLFTGQVEIPLVPTINAHATSKQYVDQQISNVVSGLVFQSTWDASSTPGGNPDLTDASKKVVGHYYVVSVAGSATPNGAGTLPNSWNVGDWCIYVEQGATDRWEKLDQTFVSGAGAAGQVTYWNSQNEVAGDNNFFWDNTNKRLGIGITTPERKLHLHQGDSTLNYIQITNDTTGQGGGDGVSFGITSNEIAIWNNREATDTSISTNNIERMVISSAGDIFISPRDTAASSGSGILYFKNVDDNSATISGGSIRTVDSTNNPSGADIRFQVANDAGTLFDAVAIDSNGFMGIGTMAPDFLLDVSGSARLNSASINSQDILVLKNGINTVNKYLGISFTTGVGGSGPHGAIRVYNGPSSSDAYMSLLTTTNGGTLTQGLTQDHLGNIGIGTTTPGTKLYISSDSSTTATIEAKNPTAFNDPQLNFITWNEASGSSSGKIQLTNGTFNSNDMAFFTETANSVTEKMRITSAGKVGIGTTTPTDTLTISNDNNLLLGLDSPAGNDAQLRFYSAGNYKSIIYRPASSNDLRVNTVTSGDVLTIQQDGNVGIGTTSPSAKLEVAGDIKLSGNGTDNDSYAINFTNGACAIARDNNDLELHAFDNMVFGVSNTSYPASTERMRIDSNGKVSIQNTGGSTLNLRRDDTSIVSGDDLGSIFFQGNDPSSPYKSGVAILGQGDGTWNMGSPNVYPSRLIFQTAEQDILKTAMVIKSDQKVGIGTTTPSYTLVVSDNGGSGVEFIPQTTNNRTTLLSYNRSGSAYNTFDFDALDIHFNISGTEKTRINGLGNLEMTGGGAIYGKNYSQSGTSGTTSQVDTGIVGTISAIYDCYVVGNLNAAGSSSYRSVKAGLIMLSTDFNSPNVVTKIGWQTVGHQTGGSGGNEINVVPKLLIPGVGSFTEVNVSIIGTTQIRLEIGAYNSSHVGDGQVVRIIRRI